MTHSEEQPTADKRLAKKRSHCLNEDFCFVTGSVLAGSFLLRNPLLRQEPKLQLYRAPA